MTDDFEIVFGKTGDCSLELMLAKAIQSFHTSGTLYIGYPIIVSGDHHLKIDVLYTSRRFGLIVFDLKHFSQVTEDVYDQMSNVQTDLYSSLSARMLERRELRTGRSLNIVPKIISLHQNLSEELLDGTIISKMDSLCSMLGREVNLTKKQYELLSAFIQRSSSLRPKKNRLKVKTNRSLGAKLKLIESEISNLDSAQKRAALETFNGVQRIRGLAGSGKTIVLALKAALYHIHHPEWRIVVTFQTRSLAQQFKNLIRRFVFEHTRDEPNFENLTIMHAWGGSFTKGVYSEICSRLEYQPLDFSEAKNKFGRSIAFHGACSELLNYMKSNKPPKIYDMVFIDEAQDFTKSFFELVYLTTQEPHRIVYAYDELQSLTELEMGTPEELFGKDSDGRSLVTLKNRHNAAKQDLVLPRCYRNPPWILSAAHSLGFGIYREKGFVQMFKDTDLWSDIGYQERNNDIQLGSKVNLRRRDDASPDFFENIINKEKSMKFEKFDTKEQERKWIHQQILNNIQKDELDLDDILIIVADPLNIRSEYSRLLNLFLENDIDLHIPGINTDPSEIFKNNSIAVTTIYKAKGNEAPVVYYIGAEYCVSQVDIVTKRNSLFTALTRARAWVRVSGVGNKMNELISEFDVIKENNFELNFRYPTASELDNIRTLSENRIESRMALRDIFLKLTNGKITSDQIPNDIKEDIINLVNGKRELVNEN